MKTIYYLGLGNYTIRVPNILLIMPIYFCLETFISPLVNFFVLLGCVVYSSGQIIISYKSKTKTIELFLEN